jgi:hypothetical protein
MSASRHRLLWAVGCTGVLVFSSLAAAQAQKPAPSPGQKFAIPGSSDSVSPSQDGQATKDLGKKSKRHGSAQASPRPRPGAPVATFPGFRLLPGGGSRISVELTKNVGVEERRIEGAIIYTLRGAQVLSRNNKNALITTHFATPVARARLVPSGTDVQLVIDLRKAVETTHQVVAGENATARLEIDFPPGDYPLVPGLYEPPPGAASRASRGRRAQGPDEEYPADEPLPTEPPNPPPAGAGNTGVGPPTP